MFRNVLVDKQNSNCLYALALKWVIKYPWLIRTVFFDPEEQNNAFVVSYSEKKQEYILTKFEQVTGNAIWQKNLVNGGYGTPAVFCDYVFCLSTHDSLTAFDKKTGNEVFSKKYYSRIRSSLNVFNNHVWFSYGSHVVGLNDTGNEAFHFHIPNAFLFGTISLYQDMIIVIGTKYDAAINSSNKFIWALRLCDGTMIYEVNLGQGSIISTDTSGFFITDKYLYTANNDYIFKISADTGNSIWKVQVFGEAHRHTPVVDSERLYYTTLKGEIGALSVQNGTQLWYKRTIEGIVTPPSIVGSSLIVAADASLYVMRKTDGTLYQKLPIGHCPYSAAIIQNDMVFIGAGEPPVNGLLCCYCLEEGTAPIPEIIQMFYTGNSIEGPQVELTIQTSHAWDSAVIDVSVISSVEKVTATNVGDHIFGFTIPLKPTNIENWYVLPLELMRNGKTITQMITIELQRTIPLPAKVLLHEYNTTVSAETPFTSGAALIQMIEQHYGHTMSQTAIREIIDYLKEQSKWQDADFQTWRLIMKRALNSPAKNLAEFIQNECKNQGTAP